MTMGRARRGGSRWDDRPRRGQEEAFPRSSRGRGVDACFTCRSRAANQESGSALLSEAARWTSGGDDDACGPRRGFVRSDETAYY